MSVQREDVADDDFIPFVVRPEIRECTVCGFDLSGPDVVAGIWPVMNLKTCSALNCHRVALTFLGLHQRVSMAERQAADRDAEVQRMRQGFERRGVMLDDQLEWRRKMLKRSFALKVLVLGGSRAFTRKVWG